MAYVGLGGAMLPALIFASARAGLSFTPLNYRLSAEGIQALIERLPEPLVIVDSRYRDMIGESAKRVLLSDEFLTAAQSAEAATEGLAFPDPDSVGDRAVHLGHHLAAQGRRALAQQPDQLCHRHRRIRVGRRH